MLNYQILLFKVIQSNLVCKSFVTKFDDKLSRDSMTELSVGNETKYSEIYQIKKQFCFKVYVQKIV